MYFIALKINSSRCEIKSGRFSKLFNVDMKLNFGYDLSQNDLFVNDKQQFNARESFLILKTSIANSP